MSELTNTQSSSILFPTGRKTQAGSAVLGFLMALLFFFSFLFLAPSARKALLLRSIVRTRFQFVVLTGVAVEVKDFLSVRHSVSYDSGLSPTTISIRASLWNMCDPIIICARRPSVENASV